MGAMTESDSLRPEGGIVAIPPHDPFAALLISRVAPVELAGLTLDSPSLEALREAGVVLVVPLVVDNQLLGTINLGPRRSEQDYTSDDRALLATLASQLAPAVRLAGLARRQEEEAARRERIDQELQVARVIQQTLLPRDLPPIPGWEIDAFYRPAREVGGDFYDVVPIDGGRAVVVQGDVTDKGIPAALVMATCRAALRAATERFDDPGAILRYANDVLVDDIPPTMFVTCFCAVLDGGTFRFANAGHPLPILVEGGRAVPVRATGMPLGMLPGSTYDVVELEVPGDGVVVVASDGVAEAHGPDGSMYGFDRVASVVSGSDDTISEVIDDVDAFASAQEDDITIVVMRRRSSAAESASAFGSNLLALEFASEAGVEREAMRQVEEVATREGMAPHRVRRLGTAVAEAVMNAAEHGNGFRADRTVGVSVYDTGSQLRVDVTDEGSGRLASMEEPNIEAKIAGEQPERGWGRFLIDQLVDRVEDRQQAGRHVVTITMSKEGP
jgi:serine phosphatase RsbU (regulator of sigma subunit)/anti-sigma regulatory factor (Ser/Thr protein kinase)